MAARVPREPGRRSLKRLRAFGLSLSLLAVVAVAGAERDVDLQVPNTLFIAPIGVNEVAEAGDLSRFQYVIVNAWDHGLIPELKTKNPEIKVLVYKDMSSTRTYHCENGVDAAFMTTGVGYCFANSHHPDWFTTDEAGNRIEWQPWPGAWQMDVGNVAYQDTWFANVLAELKRHGWDGVAIDNANIDHGPVYFPGRQMQEYPSPDSYQAATRQFLARVGPRLKREGFIVVPNIQSHKDIATPALWADWTQFTSGGLQQHWMRWDSGRNFGGSYWLQLQETFELMQRQGKLFLTGTPAPPGDVATMQWGRASFLVGWNGAPAGYGAGKWDAAWTIEIGLPIGRRYPVGTAWRRDYTGGTAIANISEHEPQAVALEADYLLPDGSLARTVTLPPLSGLVLTRP